MDLESMGVTEIFIRYADSRLCRRLDGAVRWIGELAFVPVEDFHTGERFEPRMDHLHLCTEMEIMALASRGEVGGRNG